MATSSNDDIFGRIQEHAFRRIPFTRLQETNLYVDRRIRAAGESLGPPKQEIVVDRSSVLVFVDDQPRANFAHACRYLLYDPETAHLHREIPARFPPFVERVPETLLPFHEPVRRDPNPNLFWVRPILRCPILWPDGNRYAILFSGMSNLRHLNDLEFCYRTLRHRYGFRRDHITVLNYDGTVNAQDGPPTTWPGDGSAYQIQVDGPGTRAALEGAFDALKSRLRHHDLLFLNTNNHGDNQGAGRSALCTYPNYDDYFVADFVAKLGELPKYRSLIVCMEQCFAGGFNAPILAHSTANATSVASAATEFESSWASPDLHWDSFARDWVAAQAGHNPDGSALASNPDVDSNGVIEAEEAYGYALAVQNPSDSPNFSESSEAGGDITLGQHYVFWWWWCWIILPLLEEHYRRLPEPEFYERLEEVIPELQKVAPQIEQSAVDLRREVRPGFESMIEAAFRRAAQ